MNIKLKKIGFLFALACGMALQAQQSVSLKEAITYALQYKADAVKAKLDVKNADYLIAESKAGALPKLNASGGITYNPILQQSALPGDFLGRPGEVFLVPFGQKWGANIGVQLQQALFNQQVFVGLKAARTTKEFYQLNQQLTDEKLIENVATAYYQVFSVKQQLSAVQSSYHSTEKARDIIKSLYENGLAKKIDLDRVNVQLTNLQTSISKLKNGVTQSENALKFYIGMPISTPITLVKDDLKIEAPLLDNTLSPESRTEIKALAKQKQLLEYNVQASKAAYYPTLSLVGNYAWQATGNKFPIGNGKSQQVYWTDFASIGVQLNIPIFNGFAIKSKVNQNKIKLEALEADIKDAKLGIALEYQNAKAQINNSLDAINAQQANMDLAGKVLEDTQNNYRYGLATLTDLLDAEDALVQAKINYNTAVIDFKLAEIQLLKAEGKLNTLTK